MVDVDGGEDPVLYHLRRPRMCVPSDPLYTPEGPVVVS